MGLYKNKELMMSTMEVPTKIRPMVFLDLQPIFTIDRRIRDSGVSTTYRDLTTERIFGIEREQADPEKRADILEVSKLIDLGLIAESNGQICGFIVGRETHLAERGIKEGEIVIVGVDPDYRGRGIAATLVNSICELFHSRGVDRVRIGLDPVDTGMQNFFKRVGFGSQDLLYYHRIL
jgi:ribosomal protein S18 acetylase RimI-like enzyme